MDFLKGWKTTLGSIGTILGGAAMMAKALTAEEGLDFQMLMAGWTTISLGLAAFGIGKKVERK